jgi:hypothetical protein
VNKVVFNSFPRSGNVYQATVCKYFFERYTAAVHMPEIFGVKEIDNITIFRKPEDAIASLIMKESRPESKIDKDEIIGRYYKNADIYREYMQYAIKNKENIYIGKFDVLINDTVKHFENIAKYFNIELLDNYEDRFLNAKLSGNLWDDRYDGHIPRPKNDIRINIEEVIKNINPIKNINKEYEDFISEYATIS